MKERKIMKKHFLFFMLSMCHKSYTKLKTETKTHRPNMLISRLASLPEEMNNSR